jgi:DNA repair protein RadA/Sms
LATITKKVKKQFVCSDCGSAHPQWSGQCLDCKAWNTLTEITVDNHKSEILQDLTDNLPQPLNDIQTVNYQRISTGISEFDKTLGGESDNFGLVEGSVVLIGGDPGIGKSTLILQVLANINKNHNTLYVSGEESAQQVGSRAKRLKINSDILLFSETNLESIISLAKKQKPKVMVIDSIQTVASNDVSSTAGSVSQVRECASILTTFAKKTGTTLILIGHVTKGGALAGPRILEHMVDCVLSFEGDAGGRYRIVRGVKNRFGAINEISVFAMMETGLKQIENPSSIFLSNSTKDTSGRVVMTTCEGTRPMLVEVQALVDEASGTPKRVCVGLEQNRLILQLAILNKHGGIQTGDMDCFVNVVGGIKVSETASDLAVIMAVFSSLSGKIIPRDMIIFGEVGLTGEVRPVFNGIERLKEAAKQGFKTAIIPTQNKAKNIKGLEIVAVDYLHQAIEKINNL